MVRRGLGKFRLPVFATTLLLVSLGLGLWFERANLLAWAYIHGLARAGEADRPRWVDRVANLGEAAVPSLIGLLQTEAAQPCRNTRAALDRLANLWGFDDPRTLEMVRQLAQAFAHLSSAGQENAVLFALGLLAGPENQTAPPAAVRSALIPFLTASADSDERVRSRALDLSAALLAQPDVEEILVPTRAVVRSCLQATSPDLRVRAVKLSLMECLEMVEHVVPLLQDPAPEVRKAAILATGNADHLVRDESLLPCLHDPDPEVRRLCEQSLQGRGLRPEHLRLARLLTDPSPSVRLQVLDHLFREADLDPGLWLRRLSHDPSPAVRAGALRMMSQASQIDLSDRIDQMARSDPSPTVSELARYYLKEGHALRQASDP